MRSVPYSVAVVLDSEFGERLSELVRADPVWILDTPINQAVAMRFWSEHQELDHLEGVTTFKSVDGLSTEDALINIVDTVDLHHGIHHANPPYTVLRIVGTSLTERIKSELSQYGFDEFYETPEGFRAVRPLPSNPLRGSQSD
jgi:hypothetical protein